MAKNRKELAVSRLIEALLLPETFEYPRNAEERHFCAENFKNVLEFELPFIYYETVDSLATRSGRTVLSYARMSGNEHVVLTLLEHFRDSDLDKICIENLVYELIENKRKQAEHEAAHRKQLEEIQPMVQNSYNIELVNTVKSIVAAIEEYKQGVAKIPENFEKINKKFLEIMHKIMDFQFEFFKYLIDFFELLKEENVKKNINLIDVYPSVLQYQNLLKLRKNSTEKLLEKLPKLIEEKIRVALSLNKTYKVIIKLRKILEKYNPQYCLSYKKYLSNEESFGDIRPKKLYYEGHDLFHIINKKYQQDLCEFFEDERKLINRKASILFEQEDIEMVAKGALDIGKMLTCCNFLECITSPVGFRILTDAYNHVKVMTGVYSNFIEILHKKWLKSNKKIALEAMFSDMVSSFMSQFSREGVRAEERKAQKIFESKKREETARLEAEEIKRMAFETERKRVVLQREMQLKGERDTLLKSLRELTNPEMMNLIKILKIDRNLHHNFDTVLFCNIVEKLLPFSIKNSTKGYMLFYNQQSITSFHREHGKKLDGAVLASFVDKLKELNLVQPIIEHIEKAKPKLSPANK